MKKTIYSFLIALAAASAVTSCTDERFWSDDDIIGDGEARIAATATFKSFTPGLQDSRTVGTALDGISSLTVYAFDQTGKKLIASKSFAADQLTKLENNTTKPSGSTPEPATVSTARVKFEFPLEYGKYKIYAVANADMTGKTVTDEASLKAIAFDWQSDITKNSQMFGWFDTKDPSAIKDPRGFDAPTVTVNKKDMPLTAWLVRLASKVTVSYDASKLKGNVFIFLKSVQVKDIPASCTLGQSNTPTESQLVHDGEIHYYYDATKGEPKEADFNPNTYPAVLTQHVNDFGSDHSHEADALFFYENNQGTGKNKGQDVIVNGTDDLSQGNFGKPGADGKGDGKIDFPDGNDKSPNTGYKDEKRAGTYIEVKAFYRSNEPDRLGQGEITYRFMLGKDTKTDYNAERNYHYKLTLKFNGYANDVDWHIEYEQEPGIYLPNPYYISYLYDKSMTLPVQVTGKMKPGTQLEARIVENDWMPYDYEKQEYAPESQYYAPGSMNYDYTQQLWNGFLSLRNTGHTVTVGQGTGAADANDFNKNFWNNAKKGERDYEITPGSYSSPDGDYTVSLPDPQNQDIRVFNVPFYTRAKNLVKASGYTGNNPYVSYQRKAKVAFTAWLWSSEKNDYVKVTENVDIVQVRRVVNPKGIWRASNEDGVFHVHLVRLETEFTTDPWQSTGEFQTFKSQGPWTAEVMVEGGDNANGWIKLSGSGRSTLESDGKIHGENGSDIEFDYKPSGTIGDNEVRYGIIKVRYHNLTCEHLIFVRQGYAPIAVSTSGTYNRKWYSFNMRSRSEMATSPCEEGSLFRFLAWSMPINAVNNRENAPYDANPATNGLWIYPQASGAGTQWSDIKAADDEYPPSGYYWGVPTVPKEKQRVAMVEDYLDLYNDPDVQYGFGILYDGQADGVQIPVKDAYSYYYDAPKGANDKGRGMRGCFVYNEKTGAQIFLPIGASGYGRRKYSNISSYNVFYSGELHYANRNIEMQKNSTDVPYYRPLLWDLYRRPGGMYWCYRVHSNPIPGDNDAKNSWGWDFNYITFDFYPLSKGNIMNDAYTSSDALFIRCVQRE